MLPIPVPTPLPPITQRIRVATEPQYPVVGYSREILAHDIVSHANYADYVAGQLAPALEAVLGGQPCYRRLLDLLGSADARVARRMADNESGKSYSRWLPGARDGYRRELSPGRHMMAVADELAKASKEAADRADRGPAFGRPGQGAKAGQEAARLERDLLLQLAGFLGEMKRAVRAQSVPHVTAEFSREQARRFNTGGREGVAQPGQEDSATSGLNGRVGAGLDLAGVARLTATAGVRATHQDRILIDLDRDVNAFSEVEYGATIEANASVKGILNVGVNAGLASQSGKYYEHGAVDTLLTIQNLAKNRQSRLFPRSASPTSRSFSTLTQGLGSLARKLVGGGRDRPYDGASWAAGKEEKGRYNRSRLQDLSVVMQGTIERLAAEQGRVPAPIDLGRAARECFPTMAQKLEQVRTARATLEPASPPRMNIPDEPISIPAMRARPGAPTKKLHYTGYTASAGVTASVGFRPLAQETGSGGVKKALDKVKGFLPSAAASHGFSRNKRELPLRRDLPVHEVLAPAAVLDQVKGIERIDDTVLALMARIPPAEGGPLRSGKPAPAAPVWPVHPAFATLRRFENRPYATLCLRQGASAPYLATTRRLVEEGRLPAVDLLRDLDRRLAEFEATYGHMISRCHEAKEAWNGCQPLRHLPRAMAEQLRQASAARLAAAVGELNGEHWNGWYAVDRQPTLDKLVLFIGQTVAQSLLALTRLTHELTLAKQALAVQGASLSPLDRERTRALCQALDARVVQLNAKLRDERAPLTMDERTGLDFFSLNGSSRRKLKTWTSNFTLTAGLPAAVTSLIGNGAGLSTLRGPEVQVAATQSFNHVGQHPNLYREGDFYTLNLSFKAGAGLRSMVSATEKALRQAHAKGHLPAAFAESIRQQVVANLMEIIDGRGDTLAAATRSSGVQVEMSYGRALPRAGESPHAYLRYARVMQQTTHDNSVRAPNVLLATGLPVTFNPGVTDVSNRTSVLITRHGDNVRHLILEYSGYRGFKDVLKGDPATGALDFETTRRALLAPAGAPLMEGWCHRRTPLVDVVGKYLAHVASSPRQDPSDEFAYMDADSEITRRVERTEPQLRYFAAGSGLDPFEPRLAETSRQRLARLARDWQGGDRLEALRHHMASLPSDEARVDFLTRDARGQQLLSQAAAVLEAYSAWGATLRTVIGYAGEPNHASIDKLPLRAPPPQT